jgi:hypothetical protein
MCTYARVSTHACTHALTQTRARSYLDFYAFGGRGTHSGGGCELYVVFPGCYSRQYRAEVVFHYFLGALLVHYDLRSKDTVLQIAH